MHILTGSLSPTACLQVLVLEINKVLLPARLEIQGTDPVSAVTLSLLEPETQVHKLPLSHLTRCYAFLSPALILVPELPPQTCPLSPFFSQEDPSSWTFPVTSICGIR